MPKPTNRLGRKEGALGEKGRIREFIMKLAVRRGVLKLDDEAPLTSAGVLDSLWIFRLVFFVEETFSVEVGDEEITSENFRRISAIQEYVLGKLDEAHAPQ